MFTNPPKPPCTHGAAGPWQVGDTHRWQQAAEFVDGGRRRQSVYDKKPQRYAKTTEQHSIVRSDKSEADVTQ